MTRATTKTKTKKSLHTTLGQAPECENGDRIDISHLQKPIDTSIFGLQDVLSLFKTATAEVQRYVAYECDIMYECRICRTIFRSLANFVLHKRKYCQELYRCKKREFSNENLGDSTICLVSDDEENNNKKDQDLSQNNSIKNKECVKGRNKRNLCTILPRLIGKQESVLISDECLKNSSNDAKPSGVQDKPGVFLQRIKDSNCGVFQTAPVTKDKEFDYMRTEVMEIHNVLENNEAVIGADGKIVTVHSEDAILKNNLTCTHCAETFSTKKTLRCHVKYRHNCSRMIYKCTDCSDTFANTWGVIRHLYKAHRKSPSQVRKLRSQISNNVISRSEDMATKLKTEESSDKTVGVLEQPDSEDKQWLNDLEGDNDLQICGGCGRKFERKAALISHSHFCTKRIALCNSIKGNTSKKVHEAKCKEPKPFKVVDLEDDKIVNVVTRRRKPLISHKILRFDYYKEIINNEEINSYSNTLPEEMNTVESKDVANVGDVIDNYVPVIDNDVPVIDNDVPVIDNNVPVIDNYVPVIEEIMDEEKASTSIEVNACEEEKTLTESSVEEEKSQLPLELSDGKENFYALTATENNVEEDKINLPIESNVVESNKSDASIELSVVEEKKSDSSVEAHSTEQEKPINEISQENEVKDVVLAMETSNFITVNKRKSKDCNECTGDAKRKCKEWRALRFKSSKYIDKDKITCLPCVKTFKTSKSLMKHMAGHFNWNRYQCTFCQYKSYQKSKCEDHVVEIHDVQEKNQLEKHIVRISHRRILELSTDFVHYIKTCDDAVEHEKSVDVCAQETQEVAPPVFKKEDASITEKNMQISTDNPMLVNELKSKDSSVRKMIMEVIFGSDVNAVATKIQQDPLVAETAKFLEAEKLYCQSIEENRNGVEEESVRVAVTVKDPRPVRNRTATVKKDFLYDMTQILKLKPMKCKGQVDCISKKKPIKMYGRRNKPNFKRETKPVSNKSLKLLEDIKLNNNNRSEL